MRTSNKLLLIFFFSCLGFFVVVNLALKIRYNQGHILLLPDPEGEMITWHGGQLPAALSLNGNMNVRIIPSDTFSLQWERRTDAKFRFSTAGDSLTVGEDDPVVRDPHNPWQNFADHPWVYIYCGRLQHITLSGVIALLRGTPSPGKFGIGLDISKTQLCLGEPSYDQKNSYPFEYYDSVAIHCVDGNLQLFKNMVARNLVVQLDDRSEIRDFGAQVDSPRLRYTDSSDIHLTGRFLRRIK